MLPETFEVIAGKVVVRAVVELIVKNCKSGAEGEGDVFGNRLDRWLENEA